MTITTAFTTTFLLALAACGFAAAAPAAPGVLEARDDITCPAANGRSFYSEGTGWKIECGTDRDVGDMPMPNGQYAASLQDCIVQCMRRQGCVLVDWIASKSECYTKSQVNGAKPNPDVHGAVLVSGSNVPAQAQPAAQPQPQSSTGAGQAQPEASAASQSTPATKSAKRGVCYNDPRMTTFFGVRPGSKVSWMYNWAQTAGPAANPQLTFIPMLWGTQPDALSTWSKNAAAAIASGADTLLAFNEPDLAAQSDLSVSDAVAGWKTHMQPFAGKARLATPAVTNGGAPAGLAWLRSFVAACSGCSIDVVVVHWYDAATNAAYFKKHVTDAYHAGGGKPVWITEFGAAGSDDQVVEFLKEVLPWLDNKAWWVDRYSYFMAAPGGGETSGYLVNGVGNGRSAIGATFDTY